MDKIINFIVCDDNDKIRENIIHVIDKNLIKSDIEYKIHSFKDYDASFSKMLDRKITYKIFILDIETPTKSGIDVAREIREDDYDSVIIFLTSHKELGETVLQNEFMFLAFINKFNDYEKLLLKNIEKALGIVGKQTVIRFNDHGVLYTIPIKDILYVTKESVDRKAIIVTSYTEFKVGKTLQEISDLLGERALQTHRACLVNKDKVISINFKKNLITFIDGSTTDLLSKTYKKEMKDYV